MKKRYQLEYSGAARMVVEVNDEVLTPEVLKDWNEFWSSHEERSAQKGGPLMPLLKMMYLAALESSVTDWDGTKRLKEGREEGFPKMDGSCGITIISFEAFAFEGFEVDVQELA